MSQQSAAHGQVRRFNCKAIMQIASIALRSHAKWMSEPIGQRLNKYCRTWQLPTTPQLDNSCKGLVADDKYEYKNSLMPTEFSDLLLITSPTCRHLVLTHWSAFLQHGQQTQPPCKPCLGTSQLFPAFFLAGSSKLRLSWHSDALLAGWSRIRLSWQPFYTQLAA